MKKQLILFLTLSFLLAFAACGTSGSNSASDNLISIPDSVTEVEITHIISGTESQWTVDGDELETLKNWILRLNYSVVQFEAGHSPGDEAGGEAYRFDMTGADHPGFSYVINGPDRCYLLMDGNWYSVSNPSNPPITEPQWEELTIEKVKGLAKKGDALSWSDFEPYRHTDIGSGLYIYFYEIDEKYCLVIGGGDLQAAPLYIRLVLKPYDHEFLDDKAYIEIRTENVDDFINRQNN
ncbi:hypothetical protein C823_002349 [Eubacterium plexicaudatum ASF492]|uniref:Lipoprotein n=1 Tax=Eubacterium plexicaudatum ASF492 TaxID=1235802 RepID=N2BH05_9FIRM|nr:hypothetical protein C823_002349 [Eubacterium plexicaudatum ASF492]